jgi:hypothetical protein
MNTVPQSVSTTIIDTKRSAIFASLELRAVSGGYESGFPMGSEEASLGG